MPSLHLAPWPGEPARAETLARIDRRRRPERRLLGMLAVAMRHDDIGLIEAAVAEALAWPEADDPQSARKADLLYAITALLARIGYTDLALRIAPLIPFAPGMTQVLIFSTEQPQQRFCWRVTPAYALVGGRAAEDLPLDLLIQPYRHGRVHIDDMYLRRVLLPRLGQPRPILLLPHPLGMVDLDGVPYVILDGNHRVVCAWHQRRGTIPGFVLTPEEAAAVLMSHSQWPPYPPGARFRRPEFDSAIMWAPRSRAPARQCRGAAWPDLAPPDRAAGWVSSSPAP